MRIVALLLLLCSCARNDSWTARSIQTGSPEFDSSKISYKSQDRAQGLDLEIFQVGGLTHAYFQVQSHTIAPYEGNPKNALLTFVIGENTYSDVALRHEGGQRVSLSDKMQQLLLSSLQKNLSVTVRLGSFETIIKAEKFTKYYTEGKSPQGAL